MGKKIAFAFLSLIAIMALSYTVLTQIPSNVYAENDDKNISNSLHDLINNGTLVKT
jgi:hypothetical protein